MREKLVSPTPDAPKPAVSPRGPRPKSVRLTVFFCILAPWLIAVAYLIFNTKFVPDTALKPWANAAAILFGAVSLLATPDLWRAYRNLTGKRDRLKAAVAMITLPLLTAFAGAHLVAAAAYALHQLGPAESVRTVETVFATGNNRRTACDESADLEGNSILLRRKVCDIRTGEFFALRRGDEIEILGLRSRWGIEVQRYTVLPDRDLP